MTNRLPRTFTLVIVLSGLALSAGAQQAPPVLSTTPEPPPGSVAVPAQMSGLPLQVGDLPPGVVVVRVIRQSFSENIEGQSVTLEDPLSGQVLESVTDAEGRAQFTGMRVGSTVQARTTVDGESLASQLFPLPSQGGVRLVLVAGVGAAMPQTLLASATIPAQPITTPLADKGSAARGVGGSTIASVVLACTTVMMGVGFVRRNRGRHVAADDGTAVEEMGAEASLDREAAPSVPTPSLRRATAFEELVRLEMDHRAGRIPATDYAGKREALMTELIQIG